MRMSPGMSKDIAYALVQFVIPAGIENEHPRSVSNHPMMKRQGPVA